MGERPDEEDLWVGDRGATLLSFSATTLKDPVYEEGQSRGTIHYSPIMHQTIMRRSPTAPNIFDRLEFCYCTQRDLQTRRKNPRSTESRHIRALKTHPKTFHFRKDCLREWKLDIPQVRKRLPPPKSNCVVTLSETALLKEQKETKIQIDDFEKSLPTRLIWESDEKEKVENGKDDSISRNKKNRSSRYDGMSKHEVAEKRQIRKQQILLAKQKKMRETRLQFNHIGANGTSALTPRSIRKVAALF